MWPRFNGLHYIFYAISALTAGYTAAVTHIGSLAHAEGLFILLHVVNAVLLICALIVASLAHGRRRENKQFRQGFGGVARVEREQKIGTSGDYDLYSSVLTVVLDNGSLYSTTQKSTTEFKRRNAPDGIVAVVQKAPHSPMVELALVDPLDEQKYRLPAPGHAPKWDFDDTTQTTPPKHVLPVAGFSDKTTDPPLSGMAATILSLLFFLIGAVGTYYNFYF